MHFLVYNDDYYSKIFARLKSIMPEFHTNFDETDGVYLILGDLLDYLLTNQMKDEFFSKFIQFVNEASERGGDKTRDALAAEIFQPLKVHKEIVGKMAKMLGQEALALLDR